jgi:ribosomal protein S27AE
MISDEERKRLERIKGRGRTARLSATCFVAVGIVGGIPVGNGPLIMIPAAAILSLIVAGVFWSLMIGSMAVRLRDRCPRCSDLFFRARSLARLPLGVRALWGRHCVNCGLSFSDLKTSQG